MVPVAGVPPTTLIGLMVNEVSCGRLGNTVSVCDRGTPPPVTLIVTGVGAVTGEVTMLKPPTPLTAATVMTSGTCASAGLLLDTCTIWSCPTFVGTVTTADEPLTVETGFMRNRVGIGVGVSVMVQLVV